MGHDRSPGVVYEIPQTRERIRGRDAYLQFNREYPGDWHLRPLVVLGDGRDAIVSRREPQIASTSRRPASTDRMRRLSSAPARSAS